MNSYRTLCRLIQNNKIDEAKDLLFQNLRILDSQSLHQLYSKDPDANLEIAESLFQYVPQNAADLLLVKKGLIEFLNNSINDEKVYTYLIDQLSVSNNFSDVEKSLIVEDFLSLWIMNPHFKERLKYALSVFQDIQIEKLINVSFAKSDATLKSVETSLWLLNEFKDIDRKKLNFGSFLLNFDLNKKRIENDKLFSDLKKTYKKLLDYFEKHKKDFDFTDILYIVLPRPQRNIEVLKYCEGMPGYDDQFSFFRKRKYDECEFSSYTLLGNGVIFSDLKLSGVELFSYTPIELLLKSDKISFNEIKEVVVAFDLNLSLNEKDVFDIIPYDRNDVFEWLLSDDYKYHNDLKYDEFKQKHIMKCIDKADLETLRWLVDESGFNITAQDMKNCLLEYEKNGEFGLFDAFRTTAQRDCLVYLVECGCSLTQSMKDKLHADMKFDTPTKKFQKILNDQEVVILQVKKMMRDSNISEHLIKKYCSCPDLIEVVSILKNTDEDFLKTVYDSKKSKRKLKLNF